MLGDFNIPLDPLVDRMSQVTWQEKKARKTFQTMIESNELADIWRFFNEDKAEFTWRKEKPRLVKSRLDYIFTSESLLQHARKATILPSFKSDHSLVKVQMQIQANPKGPGYWKLNTSLLRDKDYIEKMNMLIKMELNNVQKTKKAQFEYLKIAVKGSSIQFASRRKKSDINKMQVLEHKLKAAETNHNPIFRDDIVKKDFRIKR